MNRWRRTPWLVLIVAMTVAPQIGLDATQAQPAAGLDSNPFFLLFPGLRTAPAPGWVRQGTRLTYYSAAASVLGGTHRYIEDPKGGWKDPVTGTHYRQEDISSASGHGYTQVNVAFLDRSVAALDVRSYGITGASGPVELLRQFGAVASPGAGGDFWLNPTILRGAAEVNSPTTKILRGPYTINGRAYNGIWIQSEGQTWVYDLDSGVLLHSSAEGQGAAIQGPVAQGESHQGASFLSQNTLVDVHTASLPWASASAPDWVARVRTLRYQGSVAVYVPGSPVFPIPVATSFERQGGGINWARYRETMIQGGGGGIPPAGTEVDRVFGPAQLGGLWIAPGALSRLRSGQVLDTDAVTHVTASVGRIGRTPQGAVTVGITEVGVAHRIEMVYDANNGMLLSTQVVDSVLNTRTEFRLVSVSN